LKQRVKTTVEFPKDGRTLFAIGSEIRFSHDEFWGKPWRVFGLVILAIVVLAIVLPFLIQLKIANLNIPPVISLAVIFLIAKIIHFIFYILLFVKLATSKSSSLFSLGSLLFVVASLILAGTFAYLYLPFLFQLVTNTLGISRWLSVITVLFFFANYYFGSIIYGSRKLDLPILVIFSKQGRLIYQPWAWWWLKNHKKKKSYIPKHGVKQIHKYAPKYLYINILGGVLPVSIACWQLSRVSPLLIALFIAITTPLFYLLVKLVANRGIMIRTKRIWKVALVVAILAVWLGDRNSGGAIAYAGITLGSLIGSDLLHLKDLKPAQATVNFSIGGAGLDDGIVSCGLYALLASEFIGTILPWLQEYISL